MGGLICRPHKARAPAGRDEYCTAGINVATEREQGQPGCMGDNGPASPIQLSPAFLWQYLGAGSTGQGWPHERICFIIQQTPHWEARGKQARPFSPILSLDGCSWPPPRWTRKKLGHWIRVPALAFTNPGEVTGPLGISIPSALKWDALLVLASLGFWPGLNENVEGVLVVITGIKTAVSQLINVENVNVWMPKDKDPAGPFRAPSSPAYCWEFVLFSLELPEQWVLGVGSAAIHTPRGCIC